MTEMFVTGSQVYGTPRPDSDIDLVMLVDKDLLYRLQVAADSTKSAEEYEENGVIGCLYFGRLNVIPCLDRGLFEVWESATEFLKSKKPVSRDRAIEYMGKKREKYWAQKGKRDE